jgi:hypothetical protein
MEVRPVGAMLIHADRQMDMTKPVGAFCDYVNVPKKIFIYHLAHHTSMSRIIFSKKYTHNVQVKVAKVNAAKQHYMKVHRLDEGNE